MLVSTKRLKKVVTRLLSSVDLQDLSSTAGLIELEAQGDQLILSMAAPEYQLRVSVEGAATSPLHAVVRAESFLKLVTKISASQIEMSSTEGCLLMKAGGSYRIPVVEVGEQGTLLTWSPPANLQVITLSRDMLHLLLKYNYREMQTDKVVRPVQRLCYLDQQGAITFNSGACVSTFDLTSPVKVLLTIKAVRLLKIFEEDDSLAFGVQHIELSDGRMQTKMVAENSQAFLQVLLPSDPSFMEAFPVEAVRERAFDSYPGTVNLSRKSLSECLGRLLLLSNLQGNSSVRELGRITFQAEGLVLEDVGKAGTEVIPYIGTPFSEEYQCFINMATLKSLLDSCAEDSISLSFGNKEALVLSRGMVRNVIPEVDV